MSAHKSIKKQREKAITAFKELQKMHEKSILTMLVIEAWEGRDVVVVDVPGTYIHASFQPDRRVLLKIQGVFIDIMCSVN